MLKTFALLFCLTISASLLQCQEDNADNSFSPEQLDNLLAPVALYPDPLLSQVLVATHSTVALNMLEPNEVLCFAKDKAGATDIISGDRHPALRDWKKGEPDLGVLFASGILS